MDKRFSSSGALTADHHDFIAAGPKSDADLEAEVKALEQRRDELSAEIAGTFIDEANQKKADELRQNIDDLENELADRQSRKD